ncbi:hypothetical protein AcV7_001986 [Taiwanofungus camphoratus]|nr:hypothetical protein AcV7_001986 [Antrodia cinnamomea]
MTRLDDPKTSIATAAWSLDSGRSTHHLHHSAVVSFDLPLSSDLLYLIARGAGSLISGEVNIVDSGDTGSDVVKVDITAFYKNQKDLQGLVQVCLLQPEKGKTGVGFFAPGQVSDPDAHQIRFEIVVRLPRSSSGPRLSVKNFQTDLRLFKHTVGGLKDRVLFGSISLSSSNMEISIESLAGNSVMLSTTNADITGYISTSTHLDLSTSNADIKVDVDMYNDDKGKSTSVNMKTSNGEVTSNISLYSTAYSQTGGSFTVNTSTSNKPISITYPSAPLDHILEMSAQTSNSSASATTHKTYEGSFNLSASASSTLTVHSDPHAQDPAGRGRRQDVEQNTKGKSDLTGKVQWVPSQRKKFGSVNISTSKRNLDLFV